MNEIHITLDLDDIKEVRENGHIVRDGVCFTESLNADVDRDEYERVCALSESTLYREGEAHWTDLIYTGGPDVHVTFERPSLKEIVDAEIDHIEDRYDESMRVEQREWLDGQLYQLTNIQEFLDRK